jgi:hypothetical protein
MRWIGETPSLINETPPAASGEFLSEVRAPSTHMAALVFQKSMPNFSTV